MQRAEGEEASGLRGVDDDRLAVNVTEAARLLSVGRTQMWELIWRKAVPSFRVGRAVRVPVEGLRAYVAAAVADNQR